MKRSRKSIDKQIFFQKKALQNLKSAKPEPEKVVKRAAEPKDAREVAKKLLKSGAINPIVKQGRA